MPMRNSTAISPGGELGTLLRHWRDLRGKSQFDLSLDTGVSQRHISFIEIGRSVPSRHVLIDIATALDMPLRDRNTLLLAGGYAPIFQTAPGTARICTASPRHLSVCCASMSHSQPWSWTAIGMCS